MTRFIVSVILLALASTVQAKLYLELSIEGGGETHIGTSAGEEINAGGGLKLALGIQKELGENGGVLSLSLGKLFQNLDASNGTAKISTFTFDAIYSIRKDNHRFGIGDSYHKGPTYEDDILGFAPLKLDFDNALGLILQNTYALKPGFEVGARLTEMDYEVNGFSLDAGSFGIFISNRF